MAVPELPDDITRWPRDPYQLLGVNRETAPREVRLAYTRLIRCYKPEQYPDHFRRIREAYERVQAFGSPGGAIAAFGQEWAEPPLSTKKADRPASASGDERSGTTPADNAPQFPKNRDTELQETWNRACGPDRPAAYRDLLNYQRQWPADQRPYTLLYWLLAVDPLLDPRRQECDWLAQGLLASGYKEPLRQLYQREVLANPAEALTARFSALLKRNVNGPFLLELLERRWIALAGRADNLDLIIADLEKLDRVMTARQEGWARILLIALHHLAWLAHDSKAEQAFDNYRGRLAGLDFLQWQLSGALDRLDFSAEMARSCRDLSEPDSDCAAAIRLIESYWRFPQPQVRPALAAWLRVTVLKPRHGLQICDKLKQQHRMMIGQLLEIIGAYAEAENAPSQDDLNWLAPIVFGHFNATRRAAYGDLRPGVLDFCLRQSISPDRLAAILLLQQDAYGKPLMQFAESIRCDLSLQCVFHAHRLFWA